MFPLSPAAQVVPTLALYDTMQYMRSKTATVCYGLCLGMGGFLLTAGGEKVWNGFWVAWAAGMEDVCPPLEWLNDARRTARQWYIANDCLNGPRHPPPRAGLPLRNAPQHPHDASPVRRITRAGQRNAH